VLIHNPLGNGQSKSGTAQLAAAGLVCTIKALEDPGLILVADADSAVTNSNHGFVVFLFQGKVDAPPRGCVLDRIVEQDVQQSRHGRFVPCDKKVAVDDIFGEPQLMGGHRLAPVKRSPANRFSEIEAAKFQRLAARVGTS